MEGRPHPPIRPESRRPIAIEATAPTQTGIPRITRILYQKIHITSDYSLLHELIVSNRLRKRGYSSNSLIWW